MDVRLRSVFKHIGYGSFGRGVEKNILSNYPDNGFIFIVLRLLLATTVLVACPVNLMPVRESVIAIVRKASPRFGERRISRQVLGIASVILCALVAQVCPDAVLVIRVLGGVLATFVMITFPTIMWGLVATTTTTTAATTAAATTTVVVPLLVRLRLRR